MEARQPKERGGIPAWIKIAVIVAALGLALWITLGRRGDEAQLDTAESATTYICLTDNATMKLTPAAFEKAMNAGRVQYTAGAEGTRGRAFVLQCERCGKFTAVPAVRCEKDQTLFGEYGLKGEHLRCPKCRGDATVNP